VIRIPPDIMVEVVTPTARDERRDRLEKVADYAAFGVRFYWIVDPQQRVLEVFELVGGALALALRASGLVDAVPGCEGLRIDLDELWREVERLEQVPET
jgi:Uma2 family endonuclease